MIDVQWENLDNQFHFLNNNTVWDNQWCIAKNGGGYTQRGVAKVPCLFMITEVSTVADLGEVWGVRPHPPWRPSEKFMVYQFRKQ